MNIAPEALEAEAGTATRRILDEAGYRRVIVIDDEAPSEPWLLLAELLQAEDREAIGDALDLPFQFGQEGWQEEITKLDRETRGKLVGAVSKRASDLELASEAQDPDDLSALNRLLKNGPSLIWCTPDEWQESGERYLAESADHPTLLLVDRDLGEHGDGVTVIHDVLKEDTHHIKISLLTATVGKDDEFQSWQEICDANGWDLGDVGMVSKEHLIGEPIGFPRMLKMSLTAGSIIEIRNQLLGAFSDAAEAAAKGIESIDLPVLVQIVFESSYVEGVDEPTTMLRLLYAFLYDEVDKRIYASEKIRTAVNAIRSVVTVATGEDGRLTPLASKLQATERYVVGDLLNTSLRQLACGDVFEDERGEYWVLCEQPCDVILRSYGKRLKKDRLRVVPVKMLRSKSTPGVATFELRDFPWNLDDGRTAYALPTQSTSIPADILDSTTMSTDGRAKYPLDDSELPLPTAGMESRRTKLLAVYEKALEDLNLDEDTDRRLGEAKLPRSEHPVVRPTITKHGETWTVSYGIKRVGRLRERVAEAVLSTFGLAVSRSAETHDLARIADD